MKKKWLRNNEQNTYYLVGDMWFMMPMKKAKAMMEIELSTAQKEVKVGVITKQQIGAIERSLRLLPFFFSLSLSFVA